jgi:DNA-binding MarR family transcriptional regulator
MPRLHEELKQAKPFASLEEEVYLALLRTADLLSRPVEALFKEHGISPTQYNALRILRGAGKQGLPCSEIASRMITRDPDITRLLDRLTKMKLAQRVRDENDRRVVLARITTHGLEVLRRLDGPVADLQHRLLGGMGVARLGNLVELLEAVREFSG